MMGIDFEVKRSTRRKTISLKIQDAKVYLYVPFTLKLEKTLPFLLKKQNWIHANLQEQVKAESFLKKDFINGDGFLFLGEPIQLKHKKTKGKSIVLNGDVLLLCLPELFSDRESRVRMVKNWYRQQAVAYITERVAYWKPKIGVTIGGISVRTYKSRWGSCDSQGHLKFNWKLIMAPKFVVDYVVVHELCHRVYMNHSILFWQLVESHFPATASAKTWLKKNEGTLSFT